MAKLKPAFAAPYRGVWMRSRLEATWAAFFDGLGMRWRYEPCAFDLDDESYHPDFWFPDSRTWVEVKGQMGIEDMAKLRRFLPVADERNEVVVLCGAISGVTFGELGAGMELNLGTPWVRCGACEEWSMSWQRCRVCSNADGRFVASHMSGSESPVAFTFAGNDIVMEPNTDLTMRWSIDGLTALTETGLVAINKGRRWEPR